MRIGLDALAMQSPRHARRGIGRYAHQLISAMRATPGDHELRPLRLPGFAHRGPPRFPDRCDPLDHPRTRARRADARPGPGSPVASQPRRAGCPAPAQPIRVALRLRTSHEGPARAGAGGDPLRPDPLALPGHLSPRARQRRLARLSPADAAALRRPARHLRRDAGRWPREARDARATNRHHRHRGQRLLFRARPFRAHCPTRRGGSLPDWESTGRSSSPSPGSTRERITGG